MIKPDGFKDTADIKAFIKKAGYKIVAEKQIALTEEILKDHYDFLADKPFFPEIVEYMTSDLVLGMVIEGENAIAGMRQIMGKTDPNEADEGTIRKAFAKSKQQNVIHGSDAPETAEKEIKRFFPELAGASALKFVFEELKDEFAICKVEDYKQFNLDAEFAFLGKTDEERSLICKTTDIPKNTTREDKGYNCVRLAPQFDLHNFVGVIGYIAKIFARNGINILVKTTSDTAYFFYKKRFQDRVVAALLKEGHRFVEH